MEGIFEQSFRFHSSSIHGRVAFISCFSLLATIVDLGSINYRLLIFV